MVCFQLVFDINAVANVEQLKQKVAEQTNSTVPAIKLIHKGKILKDDTPLASLNLIDGENFHAVIKAAESEQKSSEQPSTSTNSQQVPNVGLGAGLGAGLGGMGGMGGLGGFFGGMGGLGGMGVLGGMGGMGGLG